MKKTFSKGFTLIELLVVIAIIGILASVVLASLNSARTKGADAAIKANLDNMRAEAAIFYDSNGSAYAAGTGILSAAAAFPITYTANSGTTNYSLVGDSQFYQQGAQALAQGGANTVFYFNNANLWVVAATLKSNTATSWCVDSVGNSKVEPAAASAAGTGVFTIAAGCN